MFNLAITFLTIGFGSGIEALRVKYRKGVYYRGTRLGLLVILLVAFAFFYIVFREETFAQWTMGAILLVILAGGLIPYERANIQIRNGSHKEAHRELKRVLEEEGFAYEISSSQFDHSVYRIPALGRSKLILKEKDAFIKEEYIELTEMVAVYAGYSNPLKEAVETYVLRMRDLRAERSFSRTSMIFGSFGAILLIVAALLMFQAWQSPWEYPNQRIDELFD